jgi:DNA-binding LytR/AlgR family response regulator
MSDAHDLRAEINNAINLAERTQAAWQHYREAIEQLQSAVLLLDINSEGHNKAASAARMAPVIGKELVIDAEVIGQVKSSLQEWLPYV